MNKASIVGMYGVVLYFVLRKYYQNGNSGLPVPTVFVAPTYLYAILGLTAEFTGGFSIVLAAGLTVALVWQAQGSSGSSGTGTGTAPGLTGPVGKAGTPSTGAPPGLAGPTPQAAPSSTSGPISTART